MDRRYGVSTSELRGEGITMTVEESRRIKSKEDDKKYLSEVIKLVSEILPLTNELVNNPLKKSEFDVTSLIVFATTNSNLSKFEKVNLLMNLNIDMANELNVQFSDLKSNENYVPFYLAVDSFVKLCSQNNALAKNSSLDKLRKVSELMLSKHLVNKYLAKNSSLDIATLKYLIRNGLLK